MKRFLLIPWLLLFITALASLPSQSSCLPSSENGSDLTPWDSEFRKWGKKYLPQADWKLLVAQSWQESAWDTRAVSRVGARGLMQTMPRTHAEIGERLGVRCSPFSAKCSIMYGAYYDGRMAHVWRGRNRTFDEITPLMLSSYNCGAGCVIKAQKLADDARDWKDFAHHLPREAREYPVRILKKYREFSDG